MFIPRPMPPIVNPAVIPVVVVGAVVGWAAKSLWDVIVND